eukprot:CAMPEP_0204843526 /NCGR_PEP_ID=MMETSP1346-20131115/48029_1 /ASSEMBLY_ACC=CAM_ASM_000771 /TAXON_ID=215587 /ORGANISM="Aplanochytrium stocchinoi, Strain GSBS06" /LENGTH=86 /DNA_ID=CAMNT_0051982681 /DNA_START=1 /DNA_END=261 /DNA_ORIENTATION=+
MALSTRNLDYDSVVNTKTKFSIKKKENSKTKPFGGNIHKISVCSGIKSTTNGVVKKPKQQHVPQPVFYVDEDDGVETFDADQLVLV